MTARPHCHRRLAEQGPVDLVLTLNLNTSVIRVASPSIDIARQGERHERRSKSRPLEDGLVLLPLDSTRVRLARDPEKSGGRRHGVRGQQKVVAARPTEQTETLWLQA